MLPISVASGIQVYAINSVLIVAGGMLYSDDELGDALANRVCDILWDTAGDLQFQAQLAAIDKTGFSSQWVKKFFAHAPFLPNWRVGEGLAEAYLVDHRDCVFPWPTNRDLKNRRASESGAELAGFQRRNGTVLFAFAEVKTSYEIKTPPGVMYGLRKQILNLRDDIDTKMQIVRYLNFRAKNSPWKHLFDAATANFLSDPTQVSIFGFVVRDTDPNTRDLSFQASNLEQGHPQSTYVELLALYLPKKSIATLSARAKKARKASP